MSDYTYNPDFDLTDYAENQDINIPKNVNDYTSDYEEEDIKESTSLNELDQIELANRNSDQINIIPDENNQYPDVLEKPLYKKVVPENGIIEHPSNLTNKRTKMMSSYANNMSKIESNKTDLGSQSVNELLSVVSSSLMGIINDLLTNNWGEQGILSVFTKEQRLFSLGVVFVIVSVFFIFFKKST